MFGKRKTPNREESGVSLIYEADTHVSIIRAVIIY